MYGYIYLTTNLINGKKYIGQHKYDKLELDETYKGSGILIQEAIKKYGANNFDCSILEFCESKEELSEKEIYYIKLYNAVEDNNFYNLDDGRGNSHEYTCEESTAQKLSEIQSNHRTINNGHEQKVINLNELDYYLTNGYILGRLPKDYSKRTQKFKETHYGELNKDKLVQWKNNISKAITGRKWVHNDFEEKQIPSDEVEAYMNNGYAFGRLFAHGKSKSLTTIESIDNDCDIIIK